jgi:hypothetical protein
VSWSQGEDEGRGSSKIGKKEVRRERERERCWKGKAGVRIVPTQDTFARKVSAE